jgi:hypothetical protein
MRMHPYRDVIDYNQLLRCNKQRKHFSGAGNVQCVLFNGHSEYCRWPDHEDWHPQMDDFVRISYPYENNPYLKGKCGLIEGAFSIHKDLNIKVFTVYIKYFGEAAGFKFYKDELELIFNDDMRS